MQSPLKSMPYLSEMTTTAMSISPISNSPASSKDGTPRSSPTKAESPLKPASPAKAASEARIGSPKKPASPSKAASFKKEAKDASPSKKPARAVSRAKSPSKGSPKAVPVAPTAAPEADAAVAYPAGARAVEREVESPPAAVRPVVAIKAPEAEIVAEAAPVAVVVAESPSAVARTLVLSHQISAQGSMSTLQVRSISFEPAHSSLLKICFVLCQLSIREFVALTNGCHCERFSGVILQLRVLHHSLNGSAFFIQICVVVLNFNVCLSTSFKTRVSEFEQLVCR